MITLSIIFLELLSLERGTQPSATCEIHDDDKVYSSYCECIIHYNWSLAIPLYYAYHYTSGLTTQLWQHMQCSDQCRSFSKYK